MPASVLFSTKRKYFVNFVPNSHSTEAIFSCNMALVQFQCLVVVTEVTAIVKQAAALHNKDRGSLDLLFYRNKCFVIKCLASSVLIFALHGIFQPAILPVYEIGKLGHASKRSLGFVCLVRPVSVFVGFAYPMNLCTEVTNKSAKLLVR